MANPDKKVSKSVPGKYYVDTSCISCGVCNDTAPNNFQTDDDEGYSFVARQPENDEEEGQVKDAMDNCPEGSIGDDGE